MTLFLISALGQLGSFQAFAQEQHVTKYVWSLINMNSTQPIQNGSGTIVGIKKTPNPTDWQYGVSMGPSYSTYQSIEMPTAGMHWTTPPLGTNVVWAFWVSSTTTDSNFAQNGFIYNGQPSSSYCEVKGPTCIPPKSWGLFWTYTDVLGNYYGSAILPPSGWNPGDHIYFSVAVYPATKIDGDFAFWFTDSSNGQRIIVNACDALIGGQFSGNVGGISENPLEATSGFGNIYVDQATLWAQSSSTGQRVSDHTSVLNTRTQYNQNPLIQIESSNSYGEFQVGYNQGQYYNNGAGLTSGLATFGNEYFPSRGSCSA
jgi:hypothetical protein